MALAVKTLFLSQEIISQADFEQLVHMLCAEMTRKDFAEIAYVLSVCGHKPAEVCHQQSSLSYPEAFYDEQTQHFL